MKRALFIASIATLLATLGACMHDAQPDSTTPTLESAGDGSDEAAAPPAETTPTAAAAAAKPADQSTRQVGSPAPTTYGEPLARPATVTDAQIALADQVVNALEELDTSLATVGTDCKAAATAIMATGGKLKPIAGEAEKMKEALAADPAANQWFDDIYVPKMMAAMGGMMKVVQACQADAGFAAALEAMPIGRKKSAPPPAP